MIRALVSLTAATVGTAGILGLLVSMNIASEPPAPREKAPTQLALVEVPRPKSKPRPRPRPRPRPTPRTVTQTPVLAAVVGGLDLGLGGSAALDLGGDDGSTGELGAMTAEAVDSLPQPTRQVPADYPARARTQGITGHVVLLLDVDARGRLTDVRVASARPPGTFDSAAMASVRRWSFTPALYGGAPVAVDDVELRIDFDLDRR